MEVNKILVVRFSSLGDIILLTPLFREIKRLFPCAEVDFLTSTTFAAICENNPHIRQIIALDRKKGKSELDRIVKECKSKRYDMVFDAHRSLRSRLFISKCFGWGPFVNREIFRIDKRSWQRNLLLLTKINFLKEFPSQREAYCQLLNKFASSGDLDSSSELFPGEKERKFVKALLRAHNIGADPLIVLGPSASFPGKCWPKESFLELAQKLRAEGVAIVLVGGADDPEPEWIQQQCDDKVVNLSGKLSFLESAELLRHSLLAISNDSAVVHFAEAVKTPALSIFGPTVKEFGYGPFLDDSKLIEIDLPCRPCSRNGKGDCKNPIKRQCMTWISVDNVFQEALNLLQEFTRRSIY